MSTINPNPQSLASLAEECGGTVIGDPGTVISDVVIDSREVQAGTLFAAIVGATHDGHGFVNAAIQAGAAAIMAERRLDVDVPQLIVEDSRLAAGPVAAAVWGHPDRELLLVGVTGTNGKTSVVVILEQLLNACGVPAESIGTLTGVRTTPEAPALFRSLADARTRGIKAIAMEVSSHALVQHRVRGARFRVAAFTMLGRDHLDYHGTQEAYFAAKAELFTPEYADRAVVNVDDVHGRLLVHAAQIPTLAVSIDDVADLATTGFGTTFVWRGNRVTLGSVGRHSVQNTLVAAECSVALGLDPAAVAQALGSVRFAPGRFELVRPSSGEHSDVTVVVDYAHTPDALESVLIAARELAGDRSLSVVFGCGGDRDRAKRPEMGRAAERIADRVLVTNDNPRSEDPEAILAEILAGMQTTPDVELDRDVAIDRSISTASPGDVIVIAGKGHETTQTFSDRVVPFDDREYARLALDRRAERNGVAT